MFRRKIVSLIIRRRRCKAMLWYRKWGYLRGWVLRQCLVIFSSLPYLFFLTVQKQNGATTTEIEGMVLQSLGLDIRVRIRFFGFSVLGLEVPFMYIFSGRIWFESLRVRFGSSILFGIRSLPEYLSDTVRIGYFLQLQVKISEPDPKYSCTYKIN